MTPCTHALHRPRPPAFAVATLVVALCSSPVGAERLSIRTFSTTDGLGSSFVSHVMQDSSGYVWFATRDGLSRWNGYEFTTLAQAEGLTTPAIDRVLQTRSGEYFVIGNDGSLYSYRARPVSGSAGQGRVVFSRRRVEYNGKEVHFTSLYEDRNGTLWGGGHGVLIRGLGSMNRPIPLDLPAPGSDSGVVVHALLEDRTGSLWIGTSVGLFRLLPDGSLGHYSLAPRAVGDIVHALALDGAGRIWIGHSWCGVVVLNPDPAGHAGSSRRLSATSVTGETLRVEPAEGEAVALTTANGLPDDAVSSLLAASDGQIWVGTRKGLARFDGTSFTRYTKAHGLCDNLIHDLREDADGHLWIATPSGAMRIAFDGLAGYTVDDGLATDHVVSIGETAGGTVYAIGVDWSINTFDGGRFRASRFPLPSGSTLMWASQAGYRDRQGRWWALTHQGLYRFEPAVDERVPVLAAPGRLYTTRDGLPSSKIFRLHQDRAGALWVATRSGDPLDNGLALFDATLMRATSFGQVHGFPPGSAPSAFVEDRHGNLWIGFYQGGLARYRDGRFRTFGPREGFPPGMVTGLLLDSEDRVWISTNLAGVSRVDDPSLDTPKVRTYLTGDGLASNNVRALAEDRDGRIFAGHVRGVDRLDPDTGRVRHYGTEDGLIKDFVTSAFRDSRGDLWFGTYGGVVRLRPGRDRDEEAPPIAITGLRIAGEPYPVMELGQASVGRIVLEPDQRDIAIDYVSVSRHRAQGIKYQYSLDSANGSWGVPTAARSVNFARLPAGGYLFAVRAVTLGGKVSGTPATVAFTIRPPLWQRWWVVSLAMATLGSALFGLYGYRVHRLLEMERLKVGIASDLHDDVATNLSSIAMFSTLVQGELPTPSPLLDRITILATESVEAIREIIWSIDPTPETVASLLVRLRDAMVASCAARGIHLTVSAPSVGLHENLTPEQRKNLWLMLKEAMTNAIKHSGGTSLSVTVAPAGGHVRIVVHDNGHASQPAAESSGRGLTTMRSRAEALGGSMTIRSAPGEGTTVEFLVRLTT